MIDDPTDAAERGGALRLSKLCGAKQCPLGKLYFSLGGKKSGCWRERKRVGESFSLSLAFKTKGELARLWRERGEEGSRREVKSQIVALDLT